MSIGLAPELAAGAEISLLAKPLRLATGRAVGACGTASINGLDAGCSFARRRTGARIKKASEHAQAVRIQCRPKNPRVLRIATMRPCNEGRPKVARKPRQVGCPGLTPAFVALVLCSVDIVLIGVAIVSFMAVVESPPGLERGGSNFLQEDRVLPGVKCPAERAAPRARV